MKGKIMRAGRIPSNYRFSNNESVIQEFCDCYAVLSKSNDSVFWLDNDDSHIFLVNNFSGYGGNALAFEYEKPSEQQLMLFRKIKRLNRKFLRLTEFLFREPNLSLSEFGYNLILKEIELIYDEYKSYLKIYANLYQM
jgi:hypothetical protein